MQRIIIRCMHSTFSGCKAQDLSVQLHVLNNLILHGCVVAQTYSLTLYDSGGGGALKAPHLRFFALTHLILELHYCALVTFPKK